MIPGTARRPKQRPPARGNRLSGARGGLVARRLGSRRGFTLIEVMLALGIMTVGAMAMLGFQHRVARANRHARNVTTATQIAENWIERLKVDAQMWNLVDDRMDLGRSEEAAIVARTEWIRQLVGATDVYRQMLITTALTPQIWNGFDLDGLDVNPLANPDLHQFCASYRFSWVYYGNALRADVRVWWLKDTTGGTDTLRTAMGDPVFQSCNDDDAKLLPGSDLAPAFHVVYLSTVLRPNLAL